MIDRAQLAREFVTFCDGVEDAGLVDFARRGRTVARELNHALEELEAERSARRALQARANTLEALLLQRGVDVT